MNTLKQNKILFLMLLICIITAFSYASVFDAEFQLDDDLVVRYNSLVKDINQFFSQNFITTMTRGGRPVGMFSFALNYRIGELDVRWYHVTNFLIHIINGVLIFYFTLLTMRSPKLPASYHERASVTALISSAIFLLHPIQTESVSYISQRYESLVSLFYLCSLIAYIRARLTPSLTLPLRGGGMGGGATSEPQTYKLKTLFWYLTSIICGLLALGSKEIAITIPVIMLLYDFYFLEDRPFFRRVAGPGVFILLALIAGIFIIIGFSRGIDAGLRVRAFTPFEYFLTQFRVLTMYIRLLFLPINQNLDYDLRVSSSLFELDTALSIIFILALILSAVVSFKRWRVGSFFILWFFIILAPTSSIIPIIDLIYEHRVYLASAGVFIAVVDAFYRFDIHSFIRERFTDTGTLFIVLCVAIVLLMLSTATFQRNKVWKTDCSVWDDVVKKSPMKMRGHVRLGNCYSASDRLFPAIEEYKKAITIDGTDLGVFFNLAVSLDKVELYNQALFYYRYFYRAAPPQLNEQKEEVKKRIEGLTEIIKASSKE